MKTLSDKIAETQEAANFIFISEESSKEDLIDIINTRLGFIDDVVDDVHEAIKKLKENKKLLLCSCGTIYNENTTCSFCLLLKEIFGEELTK